MQLLEGEEVLLTPRTLNCTVLTTHRVFNEGRGWGFGSTVSILLEHVCSSELEYHSRPWLILIGLVLGVASWKLSAETTGTGARVLAALSILLPAAFVVWYYRSRSIVVQFHAAKGYVIGYFMGKHRQDAVDLLAAVTAAQNERALLLSGRAPAVRAAAV